MIHFVTFQYYGPRNDICPKGIVRLRIRTHHCISSAKKKEKEKKVQADQYHHPFHLSSVKMMIICTISKRMCLKAILGRQSDLGSMNSRMNGQSEISVANKN